MTSPMNNASMPASTRCNRRLLTMMRPISTALMRHRPRSRPRTASEVRVRSRRSVPAASRRSRRSDQELLELGELLHVLWVVLVDLLLKSVYEPQARVRQLPAPLVRPILLDHDRRGVLPDRRLYGCRDLLGKARGAPVERGDLPRLLAGGMPGVGVVLGRPRPLRGRAGCRRTRRRCRSRGRGRGPTARHHRRSCAPPAAAPGRSGTTPARSRRRARQRNRQRKTREPVHVGPPC